MLMKIRTYLKKLACEKGTIPFDSISLTNITIIDKTMLVQLL